MCKVARNDSDFSQTSSEWSAGERLAPELLIAKEDRVQTYSTLTCEELARNVC